jgi:hypothetical protein
MRGFVRFETRSVNEADVALVTEHLFDERVQPVLQAGRGERILIGHPTLIWSTFTRKKVTSLKYLLPYAQCPAILRAK